MSLRSALILSVLLLLTCPLSTAAEEEGAEETRTLGAQEEERVRHRIDLSAAFFVGPNLQYSQSVRVGARGRDVRTGSLKVALFYVRLSGLWIAYEPEIHRDFENDDAGINHGLTVGKMFSTRFGLSFDLDVFERVNPSTQEVIEGSFDRRFKLNVHLTF